MINCKRAYETTGAELLRLRVENERLKHELREAHTSNAMACETPDDDCACAGCMYAAEVRATT